MCILGEEAGPVLTIEAVEEKLEEPGPVPIEAVREELEELCLVLNAILVDPGCFCLRTRGDAPPLHPLPFVGLGELCWHNFEHNRSFKHPA